MHETDIKILLTRLGESVNETLSNSPDIHDRIREIRNAGYEIFLSVETKIGFCSKQRESQKNDIGAKENQISLNLTEYDAKFLKTLKIAVN